MATRGDYYLSFLSSFLSLAVGLVTGGIIARSLGPSGRGQLAEILFIAATTTSIVWAFIPWQSLATAIKKNHHQDQGGVKKIIIIMGIFASVLSLILLFFLDLHNNNYNIIIIAIVVATATSIQISYNGYCVVNRALGNYKNVSISNIIVPLIYLIGIVLANYFYKINVILVICISIFPTIIYSIFFYKGLRIIPFLSIKDIIKFIKDGISFSYINILGVMLISVDRLFLIKISNTTELGYYAVAAALITPLIIVAETVVQISYMEVSNALDNGKGQSIALSRFRHGQVVLIVFGFSLFIMCQPLILVIFGNEFINSIQAAYLLVIAMVFRGLWIFLDNSLQALSKLRFCGIIATIGLGAIVLFSFLLIPEYGSQGAAVALIFGYALMFFLQVAVWKYILGAAWIDFWGLSPKFILSLINSLTLKIKI